MCLKVERMGVSCEIDGPILKRTGWVCLTVEKMGVPYSGTDGRVLQWNRWACL